MGFASRRALIAALIALPVIASGKCPAVAPLSITHWQDRMASGDLTSEQLVLRSVEAAKCGADLNAFITLDADGALEQARRLDRLRARGELLGPLHGIPLAIKDNIHVAGLPNTAGTPLLENFIPNEDAAGIAVLRAGGAVFLGKTNMHELAYGITSLNAAFGEVRNATNPEIIAGGSSGGTAVAVAAGMVVAGLGSDTGGSIRIPAALNGIVGFRPTTGRYASSGVTRISHTRDTIGPMAHSVADVALLDGLLSGEPGGLEARALTGVRLGVPRKYFYENLEPIVESRTERLLDLLRQAGVELVEADIDNVGEINQRVGFPIVLFETRGLMNDYLARHLPGESLQSLHASIASADVREVIASVLNGDVHEEDYLEAVETHRPALRKAYGDYFDGHRLDAVIFPTTPLTARPIGQISSTVELNGQQVPTFATYIRNTDPGSNAGLPGLSLPLPVSESAPPVGVEIDGPEGSDRSLLALGAAMEELIKGHQAHFSQTD